MKDYVYICDNAYTREQIIQMEQLILAKLNFRLTVPTQRSYLKRFCKAAQVCFAGPLQSSLSCHPRARLPSRDVEA